MGTEGGSAFEQVHHVALLTNPFIVEFIRTGLFWKIVQKYFNYVRQRRQF